MTNIKDICQALQRLLHQTKTKYQVYLNSQKPQLLDPQTICQLPVQSPHQFIELIRKQFNQQLTFTESIINQSMQFFVHCSQQVQSLSKYANELEQQIAGCLRNHNKLKDQKYQLKEQLAAKDKRLLYVQKQNSLFQNKFDQLCSASELQRIELRDVFIEQLNKKQQYVSAVDSLKMHNERITQQLLFLKERKSEVESENEINIKKIRQLEQEVTKVNDLLEWQRHKKAQLEQTIEQKEEEIQKYEAQLISLNQVLKNPFEQIQFKFDEIQHYFIPETEGVSHKQPDSNHQESKAGKPKKRKNTLADQIQGVSFETDWKDQGNSQNNRDSIISTSGLMKKKSQTHQYALTFKKKLDMLPQLDPYYCHFILLSQAIKIRENNEKLYNVNIKPSYKQLINEKVPMHEWSQWISDKMFELSQEQQMQSSPNYKQVQMKSKE